MDPIIIARLLIAHILGDFLFQSDGHVDQRNRLNFRSSWLYIHATIHFFLAWLMCFQIKFWWVALIIASGHLLLDGLKAYFGKVNLKAFLLDQFLHVLIIIGCWCLANPDQNLEAISSIFSYNPFWWVISGYLIVIFLYPHLIAGAIESWRLDIPTDREPLYKAGRWIGIVERFLVFTFALIAQYAAIGFLLAAKSVFRFGDLREGRDKGHTEYVLIGTLLSFGLAIITGLVFRAILGLPVI